MCFSSNLQVLFCQTVSIDGRVRRGERTNAAEIPTGELLLAKGDVGGGER